MSRRGGGGGGGRRPDNRGDQPSPATHQSTHRGGGARGRGSGGGAREAGGRRAGGSGGGDVSRIHQPAAPSTSTQAALTPSTSIASASTTSAHPPSPVPGPGPSSTPEASLSGELEKLALQPSPAPPSSSKAVRFPQRPGFGNVGRKMVVRANHFLVEVADRDFHHYDVSITPEVTSKKVCRDVMLQLEKLYRESHLGKRKLAYDGGKSLYVGGPLPFSSKEFVVKLIDNGPRGSSSSGRKEREFKVAIKYASKPDLHHLQEFIRGGQLDAPQETIQVLDVALRAVPSQNYTVVGRSFFHENLGPTGELGDGVEYWRGYYQSLRPTQMGLSLNIDVSARSFYEPILVTDFMAKHLNMRDFSRPLSDQQRIKVKKALRGVKVETTYSENRKSYKVTGISPEPMSQLTFSQDDKKVKTSVVQYFRDRYSIGLKYVSLPALQAGNDTKPVYLPMELCKIVRGQRYTKRLNERQVTSFLRATCQRPAARETNIKQMIGQNNYSKDELVKEEFGIQIREELSMVDARVLPPPRLKYHDTGKETRVDPNMGQWNMIGKKMINGGKLEFWTCVNFSSRLPRDLANEFCSQLVGMCNNKGMDFNINPLLPINYGHSGQIERVLQEIHKQSVAKLRSMGQDGKQLQLLIVILPDVSGSYGKIKRICETELGIVSQCCQPKQASKLSVQYLENVALKINVKVGGRNTVLNDAIERRIPLVTDRPTIIFGADVTHPQPGEDSSPSIAAVVASMDWPEVTKYRGIVSAQAHREEIIQDLYKKIQDPQRGMVHGGMFRELFIAYRRSTGMKPHRIIFYRDGVSEGQFSQVLLYEMDAIRKACASLEDGYQPPVTFVVVQKRHHTRFFPVDHNNRSSTDRSGNILPGTVVDRKICHPTEFDFYLNSHAGIQGTSRPTHYHVLYDENNFTADGLQVLTNNLCYTYARCTRSVSIVPPAYYAHLAAFRARYYIEGDASDGGSTSGQGGNIQVRPLPVIKENVKDVMFYC